MFCVYPAAHNVQDPPPPELWNYVENQEIHFCHPLFLFSYFLIFSSYNKNVGMEMLGSFYISEEEPIISKFLHALRVSAFPFQFYWTYTLFTFYNTLDIFHSECWGAGGRWKVEGGGG